MISNLRLQHFRSYSDASYEFEPGVNIIVGPNASGKTNLLEAILVLARGSSYRAKDMDLIQFKRKWGRLDGGFDSHDRTLKIIRNGDVIEKNFVLDTKPYKRLGLERTLPTVFFEPNHLALMSRGPDNRRDFFDDILERTKPGYKALLNNYRRALTQRNALLKKGPAYAGSQIFAWNVRLSELGSQVAMARHQLVEEINHHIPGTYSKIAAKKSKVRIDYGHRFPIDRYASRMVARLEKVADLDFLRGFTSTGPHREDFTLYLNDKPAAVSASRGEARSLLLALKTIELDLVEKARGTKPIFLLDDVFSELDGKRRKALVKVLKNHQAILTTTDADAVIEYFDKGHKLIAL